MKRETNPIRISVVIPALNEVQLLPHCLRSLKNQNFGHSYEIIVVDNNSEDRTAAVAAGMGARVVFEPHRGITWARQKGLEAARGEIIAWVDADTVVTVDWLQQIYAALNDADGVVAVSGKILYTKSTHWKGKLPGYWVAAVRYGDRAIRFLLRKPGTLWGGNFAVQKKALLQVGGFNKNIEFYGEDTELSLRLGKAGKIQFNKNQIAYTSPRRFENQPLIRTAWFYVSNFVRIMVFHRYAASRPKPGFPALKIYFQKVLPVFGMLSILVAFGFFAFNPASQFYGRVYSAGLDWRQKVIALSFDDGPDEPYTSQVLNILDENGIKATFFIIGKNAEYYPEAVREIVDRGHIIGNHSYSHYYLLPFENNDRIQKDLIKTENLLFHLTGLRTALFRPPHGLRTPWFLRDVRRLHYSVITWSDMTDDYDSDESPQDIAKAILKHARPGGIIDLHDGKNLGHGVDRSNTVKALPIIIDQLKKEGYTFVILPELLHINAYK